MSQELSTEQRNAIMSEYIKTPGGRRLLASSLSQPLRRNRDYSSVARKAFWVEPLADGALPYYDKDPSVTAYVVGEEGTNIVSITKPKRVMFPLFEIAAQPEVPLVEVKARRYDVIERNIDLGRIAVNIAEDQKVFAVMEAAASDPAAVNPVIAVTGNLTSNALIDAISAVQRNDIRVANVFMNAKDYSDILKWDRDVFDPETQRDILRTGLMGNLWGANVIISRIVPEGSVYVCGEPEFFGRIPERVPLTIVSADDPKQRTIGFSIFENIGIGLYNPLGIVKLEITRV